MSHSTSSPGPEVLWLIYGEAMARVWCGPRDGPAPEAEGSGGTAQYHNPILRLQLAQPQTVVRATAGLILKAKG